MRLMLSVAAALIIALTAAPLSAEPSGDQARVETEAKTNTALLDEAFALIKRGQPAAAIERLDKIIAYYGKAYADEKGRIYCARSRAETLLYLVLAASEKKAAIALNATWSDAIFGKGFALIDLGRKDEARAMLERALELSPNNSQYTAELAEMKKSEHDWNGALELFEKAADDAALADDADQPRLKARAWRGIGYAQIELGELDKAEEMFLKCLKLDPNDRGAQSELQYIKDLRKHQPKANAGPSSQG
jgi:tetratricopeptide (TPR) repeat protein